MVENYKIRERARDTLEHRLFGNVWIMLILATLVYSLIVGFPDTVASYFPKVSIALTASLGVIFFVASVLLTGPMNYGLDRMFIKTAKGNKKIDFADLFSGFNEDFGNAVLLGLMKTVFVFLWSLLLVIPGIVKSYAYSMASYIQQESEDKNWRSCLDRSSDMMNGYKGKLFLLDLSFIGWYIVGALCLGIGLLWVGVYHSMARAHFYEELKAARGEGEVAKDNEASAEPVFEEEKTSEEEE